MLQAAIGEQALIHSVLTPSFRWKPFELFLDIRTNAARYFPLYHTLIWPRKHAVLLAKTFSHLSVQLHLLTGNYATSRSKALMSCFFVIFKSFFIGKKKLRHPEGQKDPVPKRHSNVRNFQVGRPAEPFSFYILLFDKGTIHPQIKPGYVEFHSATF